MFTPAFTKVETRDDFIKATETYPEQIANARRKLSQNAEAGGWDNRSENLWHDLLRVTELEAEQQVADYVVRAFKTGADGEKIWYAVLENFAARQVDDAWSGRGNDLRRAAHQAKIDFINDLKITLKHL